MYKAIKEGHGVLLGHVAKNNPLWHAHPNQEHLVVFQGPNTYISPNWYASKASSGKVVPTWNYITVHVSGTLRALHTHDDVMSIITDLTQVQEASQAHPWAVSDAPAEYTDRLIDHIVGIEITVSRIVGKWKVSQNQPRQNQQSIAAALIDIATPSALEMAKWIRYFSENDH
jgi:transcriptional regulator